MQRGKPQNGDASFKSLLDRLDEVLHEQDAATQQPDRPPLHRQPPPTERHGEHPRPSPPVDGFAPERQPPIPSPLAPSSFEDDQRWYQRGQILFWGGLGLSLAAAVPIAWLLATRLDGERPRSEPAQARLPPLKAAEPARITQARPAPTESLRTPAAPAVAAPPAADAPQARILQPGPSLSALPPAVQGDRPQPLPAAPAPPRPAPEAAPSPLPPPATAPVTAPALPRPAPETAPTPPSPPSPLKTEPQPQPQPALAVRTPASLRLREGGQASLPVTFEPKVFDPQDRALSLSGLPRGATLNVGQQRPTGEWLVPMESAGKIFVSLPAGTVGESTVRLRLVEPDGRVISETRTVLEIGPPARKLTPAEAQSLIERGQTAAANGDIAAARLFYQRAADGASARGALLLAETHDPNVLQQRGVVGLIGDADTARLWYERASQLGSSEATARLGKLPRR